MFQVVCLKCVQYSMCVATSPPQGGRFHQGGRRCEWVSACLTISYNRAKCFYVCMYVGQQQPSSTIRMTVFCGITSIILHHHMITLYNNWYIYVFVSFCFASHLNFLHCNRFDFSNFILYSYVNYFLFMLRQAMRDQRGARLRSVRGGAPGPWGAGPRVRARHRAGKGSFSLFCYRITVAIA